MNVLGKKKMSILEQAEKQFIKLEESGCSDSQRFMKQASELVYTDFPAHLTGEGKDIKGPICVVIPFESRSHHKMLDMLGNSLNTRVDFHLIEDCLEGLPNTPYIISDVRTEKTIKLDKGRRHLNFAELVSWCLHYKPDPGIYLSPCSKLKNELVGLEINGNDHRIISTPHAYGGNILSCSKATVI